MAKALKTAALVVGAVALVATGVGAIGLAGLAGTLTVAGISTSTLFLVSGGLTVAASLLQKTPKVTASQTDRLSASVNPGAFRHTVLGQTAMPVEVRYEEWSGKDQEYCDWIVLHASHACEAIDEIWFETTMAWSRTTGVVGKYVGYLSVPHIVLEGSPANAFVLPSGKWNQNARLTGCAYSHWRFKLTGNSKKAESPFASGLPSRITVIGRGAKLYDPRRDSTVPGGNGPMRADDQSTWQFTTADGVTIGENLPLQILRIVLGWRIRNPSTGVMKLATGSGVPPRRINLASIALAANLADELVNRSAGGQEPRYHGAGVVSEGDDPKTTLDMLCTACCARFRDTGGKLSLVVAHNDLAAAATEDGLNDDDVVGAFTWDPDAALEATPNVVRGKYVDATTNSLYQLIDYPEIRLPSLDGQDRIFPLDLGVVESPSQAQRIAKQVLQRKQYPREFSAPFDIRAWKYGVGDVVPFTFAALGFNRALFRIKDQELGQGGVCNMTLTVETAVIYAWDADDAAPVQPAEPTVYDSRNNPLILAIDEAATTADWPAITGEGKPADYADVTGDNTSKDTNAVGGRPVGEILSDISNNNDTILAQIYDGQLVRDYVNSKLFVAGEPVNTVIVRESTERIEGERATAQTIELIGAINSTGDAFVLRGTTAFVDADTAQAVSFDTLNATVKSSNVSISNFREVLIDPIAGASAKAVFALDVNGHVGGLVTTNNGSLAQIVFSFDSFVLLDPEGDVLLVADGATNMVRIPKLLAENFKALSIDTDTLALFSISRRYYSQLASNVNLPFSGSMDIVSLTATKDRADSQIEVQWAMRMRPGGTYAGYFQLSRDGQAVDNTWYWAGTSEINNIRSARSVQSNRIRFSGYPAGTSTWTLAFVFFGNDGGTGSGFIEAGSNFSVEEVKR